MSREMSIFVLGTDETIMDTFNLALIIADPWVNMILSGEKPWEMRSQSTNIRERIGFIEKGSGLIVGEGYLVDCRMMDKITLRHISNREKHKIDYAQHPELLKYKYAWVLRNVKKYKKPIPYSHPRGAVIWVRV